MEVIAGSEDACLILADLEVTELSLFQPLASNRAMA